MTILITILLVGLAAVVTCRAPNSPFRDRPWPPSDWLLAVCDVGQGDGLAMADGPGTAVVVDSGPDPGKMDRCLTGLGVRRIPLLLLTHFHADHVDGVPGVLRNRAVGEIETSVLADPAEGAAKVRAWAESAHIRVTAAIAGEKRRCGPLSWEVLWPDPAQLATLPGEAAQADQNARRADGGKAKARSSRRSRTSRGGEEGSAPNNASVVLHVRVATRDGPVSLLLTGDIEPPAQQALLAAHLDLASDILKVPHHGSRYQDPAFVAAVRPRTAVISVGTDNTYGHPAPATLALAASTGARVFRTDRDGEIVVFGSAGHLRVLLRR